MLIPTSVLLTEPLFPFLPTVLWAQRSSTIDPERNYIALTISAPDVRTPKIDLQPTSLSFSGWSETKKVDYHVKLEFFAEIDPEESKTHATSASVTFRLRKKEMKEEFWPRLLENNQKMHFLRTDFDKVGFSSSVSIVRRGLAGLRRGRKRSGTQHFWGLGN